MTLTKSTMDRMHLVKISDAIKPREGTSRIYIDRWWFVTADDEIMFYYKTVPQ